MNGLWTLQSAARQTPLMPQPAALWPSPRSVLWQRLTIFSSEYYQILIATHLPTTELWKARKVMDASLNFSVVKITSEVDCQGERPVNVTVEKNFTSWVVY